MVSREQSPQNGNLTMGQQLDAERLLREFHHDRPGRQPSFFKPGLTPEGLNSYERLAVVAHQFPKSQPAVLDLACGDGILLQYLSSHLEPAATYIGADMSPEELRVAKSRHSATAVEFVETRAQALPFADNAFDFIFCHMAFMLMNPVEPVVREIARTLRADGIFAATVTGPAYKNEANDLFRHALQIALENENRSLFIDLCDPRTLSEPGLRSLIAETDNLECLSIEHFPIHYFEKPADLVEIFMLLYGVALLSRSGQENLRSELHAKLPSHAGEDGKILYTRGSTQIVCQKKNHRT